MTEQQYLDLLPDSLVPHYKRALSGFSRRDAIRVFCTTCMGGSLTGARKCADKACPLYPYRLGRAVKEDGE